MVSVFKKKDPRRNWKGYQIYIYPHEYRPIGNKPLEWLHIHFVSQTGEIELYLKDFRIIHQWGKVSEPEQTKIKEFVQKNYDDIMSRIKNQLEEAGIKFTILWQD